MLLWLWHRPVAAAPTGPLAWEPPYALGVALEKAKSQKEKKRKHNVTPTQLLEWLKLKILISPRPDVDREDLGLSYITGGNINSPITPVYFLLCFMIFYFFHYS